MLVVANLSRFVQYVELDLAEYKGMVPVELFGKTRFPAIGDAPYMLTLGPHASIGSRSTRAGVSTDRLSATSLLPPIEIADPRTLFETEREAVADAITTFGEVRNWFGSAERIRKVEMTEVFALKSDTVPLFIAMLRADMTDGPPQTYAATLAIALEDSHPPPESVVVSLKIGGETQYLVNAVQHDDAARALYLATKDPARLKDGRAELLISRFGSSRATNPQALLDLRHLGDLGRHAILRFGEEAVMKVYHRVDDGLSTELELGRVLNSKEGSVVPILRNAVEARYGRGEPQTIALVHDFVPNAGTGWNMAIDELGRFYDRVLARPADEAVPEPHAGTPLSLMGAEPPPLVAAQMGGFRATLAELGPVVAEIHKTLAANSTNPAFAPEPYSSLDRRSKYQSLRNIAGKVFRELREQVPIFPSERDARSRPPCRSKPTFSGASSRSSIRSSARCAFACTAICTSATCSIRVARSS